MRSILVSVLISCFAFTGVANAALYTATSAVSDRLHGGSNDHAAWLPFFENIPGTALQGNRDGSDFDFLTPGLFSVNDDGMAQLSGRIVSQVDPRLAFDVIVNFIAIEGPGTGGPKKELRRCAFNGVCGSIDPSTWEYFRLTDGSFTGIDGLEGLSFSVEERPRGNVFPLQVGEGANGKNGNFGGASWFFLFLNDTCDHALCQQLASIDTFKGDFNLDLVETPLPAGLLLFATGLFGFRTMSGRGKKA